MNGRQQQQQQQQHNNTKQIPRRLRASASAALKIASLIEMVFCSNNILVIRKRIGAMFLNFRHSW